MIEQESYLNMNILVGVYTKQSVWHVDLRSGLKASELVNKWSEKIYNHLPGERCRY